MAVLFWEVYVQHDGELSLRQVFAELCSIDAIGYDNKRITHACLNLHQYPPVERYVERITCDLYEQIALAGVEYDAVTSVPRGGNAWAHAFCKMVAKTEGRRVAFLHIKKKWHTNQLSAKGVWGAGKKVLIFDDTVYTGITARQAIEEVKRCRCTVAGLVFPVEIGGWGQTSLRLHHRVFSTFNKDFMACLV